MLAQVKFDDIYNNAFPGGNSSDNWFVFQNSDLGPVVQKALIYIFPAAGILLLLYLLWGGLQLMTSGGDPKAIQSARDKITSALIGFLIVFAAYWIVQIIGSFLGAEALREAF